MKEPLRVIQGDWVASADWITLPQTLRARSPEDRNRSCRVRVNALDLQKAAENRRRHPAYEFWSVLAGKAPPVPHREADAEVGLTSLFDAHACFQGVKRPVAEDGDGAQFVAYILKPKWFFHYEFKPPLVLSTKRAVPDDLVFVAYVRLDEPAETNGKKGVLTHWHFVEADPRDPTMPVGFDERYVRQLW